MICTRLPSSLFAVTGVCSFCDRPATKRARLDDKHIHICSFCKGWLSRTFGKQIQGALQYWDEHGNRQSDMDLNGIPRFLLADWIACRLLFRSGGRRDR